MLKDVQKVRHGFLALHTFPKKKLALRSFSYLLRYKQAADELAPMLISWHAPHSLISFNIKMQRDKCPEIYVDRPI